MSRPTFRTAGTGGLLVEVADTESAQRLLAALAADPPAATVDLVPAASTLLVRFDPTLTTRGAVQQTVLAAEATPAGDAGDGDVTTIEVCYDGDDLAAVAAHTGLSEPEVVARHTAATYRVAFTGFAPGFGYLTGGDPALHVPRRPSPRTAVPAGAVGLAGEFSGVYPRTSPGGWQLVGRTDAVLWDVTREVPALLRPGGAVRFTPVAALTGPPPPTPPRWVGEGPGLVVRRTGPLALLVDDGRDGHADLGVSPAGSADRASAHAANASVGNPLGAPCLEVLLGGLAVEATTRCVVGVAGAPCGVARNGRPVEGPVVCLDPGDELRLAAPSRGLRTYLAARGGFAVPHFLGSASSDTLSGLGPAPLAVGDVLPVGGARAAAVRPEASPTPTPTPTPREGDVVLRVVPGPRDDAVAGGVAGLLAGTWTVDARSDRVGTRLRGTPLRRLDDAQLPSEGVVRGALQVPPDGQPILFGPDRPVTGGYPVVACVVDADLDQTAQLPAGTRVRFVLDDVPVGDA